MDITGHIKFIGETQQVSASFKKRELVISTDEQYVQHILTEFNQDKCDILNNYNVGESVKVSINLRGREWVNPQGETKYFNSIQGWRIEKTNEAPRANSAVNNYQASQAASTDFEPVNDFKEEDQDDLPF